MAKNLKGPRLLHITSFATTKEEIESLDIVTIEIPVY
jgi:hypothetical protein